MVKCSKCGQDQAANSLIAWKCSGCDKIFKLSQQEILNIAKRKEKSTSSNLLACPDCKKPLDDGNEQIAWRCQCTGVNRNKLADYMSDELDIEAIAALFSDIEQGREKVICPECNSENEKGSLYCTSCGYTLPTEKPKLKINKKLLMIIAIALVGLALLLVGAYLIFTNVNDSNALFNRYGLVNGMNWGASKSEVIQKVVSETGETPQEYEGNIYAGKIKYDEWSDYDVSTVYKMKNNRLDGVAFLFYCHNTTEKNTIYSNLYDEMQKKYGEESTIFRSNVFATWDTDVSEIAIAVMSDYTVMLTFDKREDGV